MGIQIYPTVPVAQPAAEPWPVDEHTIRIDEMFARQLDTEFSAGVREVLHHPETGVAALSGETALEAIAGALPALHELKERTLSQAMGPRQRGILEPLIETRLNWAAGTLGRLAERATMEVDDASVADRIAGLRQDAAAAWRDPAYLQKLGRTAVEELRYQGERRGWDPAEIDTKVRNGLGELYAGAVEAAIGTAINGDDLDGAAGLYEHARPIIDPGRQAALDRRFVRAREVAVYRDIDRDMEGIPIEPAGPPGAEIFEERAAELTPDDATDGMRARIAQVAAQAHRHAERQWNRQQAEAGVAAFDWVGKNPGRSFLAIPPEVRDWLAPDQWRGLEALLIDGRLRTDGDLFERLDWQMIYDPDSFAGVDLDRHRLSLDDEDQARFAAAQKAIAEGRIDPGLARYDRMRRRIDRAVKALGIDTNGPEAADARADARDQLDSFEMIEGRAPVGADLDDIARRVVENLAPEVAEPQPDESAPAETPSQEPAPRDVFGGADIRDGLDAFEAIEGYPRDGEDIAAIVAEAVDRSSGDEAPVPGGSNEAFDPQNIILVGSPPGSGGPRGGGGSGRGPQPPATTPQRPSPGPGHNRPPQEVPPGLPSMIENWRRWTQPPAQPPVALPPDVAGPRTAAEQGAGPTTEPPRNEEGRKPFGAVEQAVEKGAPAGSNAFHYTFDVAKQSIQRSGLYEGSYATTTSELSPLQAHIDLALSPNRGLPDVVLRIDLNGLRAAGYEIPKPTLVGRSSSMPGGGYEIHFPYAIEPQFITVIK